MVRTFNTHNIRKQQELTGKYWDFSPCVGKYAGEHFKVATPCCWESHPKFARYRGEGEYTTYLYSYHVPANSSNLIAIVCLTFASYI